MQRERGASVKRRNEGRTKEGKEGKGKRGKGGKRQRGKGRRKENTSFLFKKISFDDKGVRIEMEDLSRFVGSSSEVKANGFELISLLFKRDRNDSRVVHNQKELRIFPPTGVIYTSSCFPFIPL